MGLLMKASSFNILEDLLFAPGENNNHVYLKTNVLAVRGA